MTRSCLRSLLLVACAACSAPPAEDDASASLTSLAGTHAYVGCTPEERTRLEAAWDRVDETPFATCLGDAVLAWTDGMSAARAAEAMDDEPLVKVACVASTFCNGSATDAQACPGSGGAQVAIERELIAIASTTTLAGVLAHAHAHDLGLTHPDSASPAYTHSLPRQAQRCAERSPTATAPPPWLTRSELARETELSPAGGADGFPVSYRCPGQSRASGFTLTADTEGVRGLTLFCDDGSQGVIGESWPEHAAQCPAGDVLWGLGMTESEGTVTKVAPFCVRPADIRSGKTDLDVLTSLGQVLTMWPTYYGSDDIDAVTQSLCPAHAVMRGVRGRWSQRVHRLSVICEDIDARPQGVTRELDRAGSSTTSFTQAREVCLGNGAMVGLWGRAGAEIDALGARCSPTTAGEDGVLRTTAPASPREQHVLPSIGGPGGTAFTDNCPGYQQGDVLVGLRVSSDARVHRLQGVCAEPRAWTAVAAPVTRTYTPSRGGSGGTQQTYECPRGEVLVGMHAWADQSAAHGTPTVFGVRPLCRRIDYCEGFRTLQGQCVIVRLP